MSLARVVYIIGIILIVWAVISGFYFSFDFSEGRSEFDSGYTFKVGLFILGLILIYLGRRSSKIES